MSKKGFNLLRPQMEPPTMWTKLYDYVVGSARVVVIVVELVVVVAFGIRVIIDVQSKNLDEQIQIKETIVESFETAETRFKSIQGQTSTFRTIWESSILYKDVFAEIKNHLPPDIAQLTVQFQDDELYLAGTASVSNIGKMEQAIKSSQFFQNTELIEIKSQGSDPNEPGTFALRTQVREQKKRTVVDLSASPTAVPTDILPSITATP